MVDQERLTKMGEELAASVPADILEAKEILKQKESIISQAHLEAKRVKESAANDAMAMTAESQQEHITLVDETEIVKAAKVKGDEVNQEALQESQQILQDTQRRASRVLEEAEGVATTRREGADQYARETLFDLEERLAGQLGQVRKGIDALGLDLETKVTNGSVPTS